MIPVHYPFLYRDVFRHIFQDQNWWVLNFIREILKYSSIMNVHCQQVFNIKSLNNPLAPLKFCQFGNPWKFVPTIQEFVAAIQICNFNTLFFPQEFRHQPQQTNPPAVHNTRCPYLIQVLHWFPFLIKWESPKNMLYRATGPLAGSVRVSLHIRNMMDGVPATALYTKLYSSYNTQYRSGIEVRYTCEYFCCMVLSVFTVIYWQYKKNL